MKKTTVALLSATLIGGSIVAADADARGRHHHGHRGHHHHHHGARIGLFVGAPLFFAPYYYPRYYYPQVVPAPVAPSPVYIEQPLGEPGPPAVGAPPAAGAYWYFCRDTQTYYPYVQQCASPWERVPANSAPLG
jgi:hypothetical protein